MAADLRFSPAVPDEIRWVIDSYESISISLGNRVRDAFNRLFTTIRDHPELYAVVYDNIRIARVKPFPFLVHYRITDFGPEIVAIFPSPGDPNQWQRITRTR